jgi:hypothetical protein
MKRSVTYLAYQKVRIMNGIETRWTCASKSENFNSWIGSALFDSVFMELIDFITNIESTKVNADFLLFKFSTFTFRPLPSFHSEWN